MAEQIRQIAATVHGRYLIDDSGSSAAGLLVGFHGYAENAERHLEQLRRIPASGWALASVQALHPFYHSRTGDVAASWMTKLDREQAITDNIEYVSRVVSALERERGEAAHLVFAGFSQGAAMAYRAAAKSGRRSDGVIVLGGDVPPELKTGPLHVPRALVGRGVRDEWYTQEKMDEDCRLLLSAGVEIDALVFDGGHEWSDAFLAAAGRFLERVAAAR